MKKRIFGALGGLFVSAGLAAAQSAPPPPAAKPAQVPSPTYTAPADSSGSGLFAGAFGDPDGSTPRLWGGTEYLLWWVKSGPSTGPVLTTTSNPNFSAANPEPGALGSPGTSVVLGNHNFDYGAFSGLRLTLGGWLNEDSTLGVEASGFLLERRSSITNLSSNGAAGSPSYYIPQTAVGNEFSGSFANFAAGPGFPGSASLVSNTRLWGSEANAVLNLARGGSLTLDALAGFRFLSLEENLGYYTFASESFPGGSFSEASADFYGTQNRFYGGQLGARADYQAGMFFVTTTLKVALGDTREGININGNSTFTESGFAPFFSQGGHFTTTSNIGRVTQDKFACVPELTLNLGVRLGPSLRAFVGYDFLYWSDVGRPGTQVDTRVDTTFPFPKVPSVPVNPRATSDFWAQGINFGIEVRY